MKHPNVIPEQCTFLFLIHVSYSVVVLIYIEAQLIYYWPLFPKDTSY